MTASMTATTAEHVEEVKKPSAALSRVLVEEWNSSNVNAPIESPANRNELECDV